MVCTRCSTYNQASYILDALNGFAMQETTFPVVSVIVDDASTDNEPQVILDYFNENFAVNDASVAYQEETDYGRIFYAQHKKNKNCYFAILLLKENHYSQRKSKRPYLSRWQDNAKYIALCEGDDYWTNPHKLQKQVDFLELHPDYSLCCHRFKIFYEASGEWGDDYGTKAFEVNPGVDGIDVTNEENFRTRLTWTLTLCYRKDAADRIVWPPYKYGGRDFNFHYHLLKQGYGWCFSDYMGVYRKHNGGVWSQLSSIDGAKVRLNCYRDLQKYNQEDNIITECYLEWLDRFFDDIVISPYRRHRLTRNGIKNLGFYLKHSLKVNGPLETVKKATICLKALFV